MFILMAHDHIHEHHELRLSKLIDDLIELTEAGTLRWKVESASTVTAEHRKLKIALDWPRLMVFDHDGEIVDEVRMEASDGTLERGQKLWRVARRGPYTSEERSKLLGRLSTHRTTSPVNDHSSWPARARPSSSHAPPPPRVTGNGDEAWYARPTRVRPPRL